MGKFLVMDNKDNIEVREEQMSQDVKVLHVFLNRSPHLFVPIMALITKVLPTHKMALYEVSQHERFIEGEEKIKSDLKDNYWGKLRLSCLQRGFAHVPFLHAISHKFLPEFTLFSYLRLVFTTKSIILHGRPNSQFNLFSLCFLKLLGKRLYLIHWGGTPSIGRFIGTFDRLAYMLFSHIFVLMSPEVTYFKSYMRERVSVLSYPCRQEKENIDYFFEVQDVRKILLGNSAHFRADYQDILDRMNPEGWSKITCMLNYGDETTQSLTDRFVDRAKDKFGDVFFAWRKTLPLNEYLKVLEESAFYVCTAKTQTGLGAIYNSIKQGKTLILRGDNLKWVRELGVKAYDYDELTDFSFQVLSKLRVTKEEAQLSRENLDKNLVSKYNLTHWSEEISRVSK